MRAISKEVINNKVICRPEAKPEQHDPTRGTYLIRISVLDIPRSRINPSALHNTHEESKQYYLRD